MALPIAADVTAAGVFLTSVWDANPMLSVLFGLIAILTVGFFALRRASSALPR
jgi:hypothetical protein